ncbi:MAG: cold shock domain-containing protein [Motilibacteraceae bacterium]
MIEAVVREWHDELGWGVLDSEQTPGGCWAHFSAIEAAGYASLSGGDVVLLEHEPAQQDGYAFRALRVRVPGGAPDAGTVIEGPSAAYRSSMRLEFDEFDEFDES